MTKLLMKCGEKGKPTMGKSTLCYFTFIISVENNTIYITKSSRVSMYIYLTCFTTKAHKPTTNINLLESTEMLLTFIHMS